MTTGKAQGLGQLRSRLATAHLRTVKPGLELLDDRVMPVVGAFNVPKAIQPSRSWAGVVQIRQSQDDIGGASGTLLPGGQYILTAAHVVDTNGDHRADEPYYYVNYDLPAGRVQMVVPGNRIRINPDWQGATDDGFKNGHDQAILQLSGVAPWGNGPGALSFELYTGGALQPGTAAASSTSVSIIGYGYTGDGTIGQNTSPNPDQIASTVQRLMLPPTATGTFTLGNPTTKDNIRLNARGLTAEVVQKAVQSLDPTGFIDVQVVQLQDKKNPYFGSFDIVFRQVDATKYPYGAVPQLTFRPQIGFSGGSARSNYRTGIMRPAFPTVLGTKALAGTYFNSAPEGLTNVFVSQLNPTKGLALLGQGDSGGPALLTRKIVGVASFYSGTSQFGDFSGWSSIAPDLAWIQANTPVGGNVVIDLATQPITKGHTVDYVSVKGDPKLNQMIVLVHGQPVFKSSMSSVKSVQIVPRGVPVQSRTIGKPTFTVTKLRSTQRGAIQKVGRVAIMGETTNSVAVVNAKQNGFGAQAAKHSSLSKFKQKITDSIASAKQKTSQFVHKTVHSAAKSAENSAVNGIEKTVKKWV